MKSFLNKLKIVYTLFNKKQKFKTLLLFCSMFLAGFLELVSIGLVFPFLASIGSPEVIINNANFSKYLNFLGIVTPEDLILVTTIGFITAVLISSALRLFLLNFLTNFSFSVGSFIARQAYTNTLKQNYENILSINTNEVISTITNKTHAIIFTSLIPFLTLLNSIIIAFVIGLALFLIDPKVTVLALVFFAISYLIIGQFSKNRLKIGSEVIARKADHLIKILQESFGSVKDIILNQNYDLYIKDFRDSDWDLRKSQAVRTVLGQSPRFVMEGLGMTLIATFAYVYSSNGNFSSILPLLGTFALAAQRLLPILQQGFSSWANIQSGQVSLEDIVALVKNQPLNLAKTNKKIIFNDVLELKDVSYSYPSTKKIVLENVNLKVKKNQIIGIIGKTGSGKTTIMDILLGLLIPSEGNLLIDGEPINKKNIGSYYNIISHVSQDIFIFNDTIEKNITVGNDLRHDDLKDAIKKSDLMKFVDERGIKKAVGERGVSLSGGQKQRIAIARSIYKNGDIIFLDEATSALDELTEQSIYDEFLSLKKTMIIVTHRLSSLKYCDEVYIVRNKTLNKIDNTKNLEDYFDKE